jgi:predicted DNA-binding mobile mystery protein A
MKAMALKQLDKTLAGMKSAIAVPPPARGWLRAIRDALGMSGPQLAKRMRMTKQGVAELEKKEVSGSLSLNTLRKAAAAMDCVLVYAVVPRDSLAAIVERQARRLAESDAAYTAHTMLLEDQLPSAEERRAALDAAAAELVRTMPKNLWD